MQEKSDNGIDLHCDMSKEERNFLQLSCFPSLFSIKSHIYKKKMKRKKNIPGNLSNFNKNNRHYTFHGVNIKYLNFN